MVLYVSIGFAFFLILVNLLFLRACCLAPRSFLTSTWQRWRSCINRPPTFRRNLRRYTPRRSTLVLGKFTGTPHSLTSFSFSFCLSYGRLGDLLCETLLFCS